MSAKIFFLIIDIFLGIGAILVILTGIKNIITRITRKLFSKKTTKKTRYNKIPSEPLTHNNNVQIYDNEEVLSNAENDPKSDKINDLKCDPTDTFCDSRGIIRKPGEEFFDYYDKSCKPGDTFTDSKGIIRFKNERFYDWSEEYFS